MDDVYNVVDWAKHNRLVKLFVMISYIFAAIEFWLGHDKQVFLALIFLVGYLMATTTDFYKKKAI